MLGYFLGECETHSNETGAGGLQSAEECWDISLENVRLTAMRQGQGDCRVLKNAGIFPWRM